MLVLHGILLTSQSLRDIQKQNGDNTAPCVTPP